MNDKIIEALNWRYAVQKFDTTKKVDQKDLDTILDAGRLAPSAFGIEPWHFIVIQNVELKQKLHDEASRQDKVADAPVFVVVAKRTDARTAIAKERVERTAKATKMDESVFKGLYDMIDGSIQSLDDAALNTWITSQVYIPLGTMIETAALLGVDAGPMEGMDRAKVDEILGLSEKNLTSAYAIAFGYRGDDPAAERPKVRRGAEDVITYFK